MSAPATVTEAHRKLAADLCRNATGSNRALHHVPKFAQLIADSEARAVVAAAKSNWSESIGFIIAERDQLRAEVAWWKNWHDENEKMEDVIAVKVQATIDGLRAEVERLKADGAASAFVNMSCRASRAETDRNNLRADLDAIKSILNEEKARAERAEMELANIRALADRRNERDHSQDTTHQLVAALDQALDIAQAELAQFRELDAERARMRQIAVDKRIRTPTPRTDEEAGSLIDAEEVVPADFSRELERELATERARMDWLQAHALAQHSESIAISKLGRHYNGFPGSLRAAIDAAMKEETK